MKLSDIAKIKINAEMDTAIDANHLDDEASKLPQLHNKYLCMLMDEKVYLETLESKMNILNRDKWLYYSGKMSEEELSKKGWEPFELNILKNDLDRFIDSDGDIIDLRKLCSGSC